MALLITFILGTAIGSFLNVWSRRLLRGEPPTGRSRCESCGHVLSPLDLIPLLSFAFLRGHCRYCRKPLSWQYPIVELAAGLLFVGIWLKLSGLFTNNYYLLFNYFLLTVSASALIVVFVTDFLSQQIFDQVLWVGLASGILYRISIRVGSSGLEFLPLASDLLGALGVYLFLQMIRLATKKRGLGDGDSPLGFWAAILAGFPLLLVELFLAFVVGGLTGAALVLSKKRNLKDRIAFGPFLVAAVFATLFFGDRIWTWYLGVLGL